MFRTSAIRLPVVICVGMFIAWSGLLSRDAMANIFGTDDRLPIVSREYPWRCIGLIVAETETGVSTGTGFLIGRNLVLTNAHCTIDGNGKALLNIYFLANRVEGIASNAVHVNHIWRGTDHPEENCRADWAVLRLDSNLGDDLGWLSLSPKEFGQAVLAGYSGDFRGQRTAASAPCTLDYVLPWLVNHDGDSTPGSSGGPLLAESDGKIVVAAINFACLKGEDESLQVEAYCPERANLALPVAIFVDDVQAIIAEESGRSLADYAQWARTQVAAQEYAAAEATLTELIQACPNNSWALLLRGYVRNLQGSSSAPNDFQEALRMDPRSADFLVVRAAYCQATANYQECIAVTSRVIMVAGRHKSALRLRAAAYDRLGHTRLALADAREAL